MRVLHVINSLGAGGAERSLSEMLPLLTRAGIESSIVVQYVAPDGVHRQVACNGYRVDVIGRNMPVAARKLRRLLRDLKPDIVHTTLFEADLLGRVTTLGTPSKVLTSLVNTTYDGMRTADNRIHPAKIAAVRNIDKVSARLRNDHFHAISESVKDSAVRHLGIDPDEVTVVERGRNTARLGQRTAERRRSARTMLGVAQCAEVIVHVGRQEPSKGQSDLLRAMKLLHDRRSAVVLLVAGREGNSTTQLRALVGELGLQGVIHFLGHREDVGELLSASDVFAFPSIYEGLGGSVLEAMAMRLPIVVSDIPPLVDVTERGRGALAVPIRDPARLADALESLLVDRGLATRLSNQGREIFDQRFSLSRSVAGMVRLYQLVYPGW